MYGTDDTNLENFEKPKVDQPALDRKAEAWEGAMGTAPGFAEGTPVSVEASTQSGETVDVFSEQFSEASKILNYGFEAASQGLGENGTQIVLDKICAADPDDPRMFVKIYGNLNLNSEAAATVSADLKKQKEANFQNDGSASFEESLRNTVKNLQALMDEVNKGPDFAEIRNKAEISGMDTVSYLLKDEKNPSLSVFLTRVNEVRAKAPEVASSIEPDKKPEAEITDTAGQTTGEAGPTTTTTEQPVVEIGSEEAIAERLPEVKIETTPTNIEAFSPTPLKVVQPEVSALNPAEELEEKNLPKAA